MAVVVGALPSTVNSGDRLQVDVVRVYAVDWAIMPRARLTVDDVRRMKHAYLELREPRLVKAVVEAVEKLECRRTDLWKTMDVRLVIDLGDSRTGVVQTLYSDERNLLVEATREACPYSAELVRALTLFVHRD